MSATAIHGPDKPTYPPIPPEPQTLQLHNPKSQQLQRLKRLGLKFFSQAGIRQSLMQLMAKEAEADEATGV